jgi:hypothetical protein
MDYSINDLKLTSKQLFIDGVLRNGDGVSPRELSKRNKDFSAKLQRMISGYGFQLRALCKDTQQFYISSDKYYESLCYRNAIADHLQIDSSNDSEMESLNLHIVKYLNQSRNLKIAIDTGTSCIDTSLYRYYAGDLEQKGFRLDLSPVTNLIEGRRYSIWKTLVFLRANPPNWSLATSRKDLNRLFDFTEVRSELIDCWQELQRHPYYRTPRIRPKRKLNQHALDFAISNFPGLWIRQTEIGLLRSCFEPKMQQDRTGFWFLPYVLFKYATQSPTASSSRSQFNPYTMIWNTKNWPDSSLWS